MAIINHKMILWVFLVFSALIAATAPKVSSNITTIEDYEHKFPGWPEDFDGRSLTSLKLSEKERRFANSFPGKIARFSDGNREIIIRWIAAPTRRLHPASDCFQGLGYSVNSTPIIRNAQGTQMGCFRASKDGNALNVCEYLDDKQGNTWSDVSAWYWSALLTANRSGWWSYVIAEAAK